MKRFKSIIALLCCFLLLTGFTPNKVTLEKKPQNFDEYIKDGYTVLEEGENYAILGKFVEGNNTSEILNNNHSIFPTAALGWSISTPTLSGFTHYRDELIRSDSLVGGGYSSLSVSATRETKITGGLEVGGSIAGADINIKLGFSKTNSITRTDAVGYSCDTKYRSCQIDIYPRYGVYGYDIFFLGGKRGRGTAQVFIGFYQAVRVEW